MRGLYWLGGGQAASSLIIIAPTRDSRPGPRGGLALMGGRGGNGALSAGRLGEYLASREQPMRLRSKGDSVDGVGRNSS